MVDLTNFLMARSTTQIVGDMGADVIKPEDGRAAVTKLIRQADVLIYNRRPQVIV